MNLFFCLVKKGIVSIQCHRPVQPTQQILITALESVPVVIIYFRPLILSISKKAYILTVF